MRLCLRSQKTKSTFIAIIAQLEPATDFVTFRFCSDHASNHSFVHIQGMDKAHVCLYDIQLQNTFFDEMVMMSSYGANASVSSLVKPLQNMAIGNGCSVEEIDDGADSETASVSLRTMKVSVPTKHFKTILGMAKDDQMIVIEVADESNNDIMLVHLKKADPCIASATTIAVFKVPLVNSDVELMNVNALPESQADFTLASSKLAEALSNLSVCGGDTVSFQFSEFQIAICSHGMNGAAEVFITSDLLTDYALDMEGGDGGDGGGVVVDQQEGEDLFGDAEVENKIEMPSLKLKVCFSLGYLQKFCVNQKISPTMTVQVGSEIPMRLCYPLGEDGESYVRWFIAPKVPGMDDD